ncbi:membrane protein [Nitrosomonas sp. PY1]|uniref:DUF808 domain-containing protein n=1 Tax=Nitrosomonas sp. PY1 TaxID=1803906 RepID=UPI001FC88D8F|nr:DUF808 domain-containing protein [Nitrosomonas sp. PY1]GKS69832.1 membrane protein [Nitrosomonas sp. PY1]
MAVAGLLALLDDIASVLDDVAALSKLAAKKTTGVLGDDLALNAQQITGVQANRELPVIWAVAKGSILNKAILVPAALLVSAFVPWLVVPLLMMGGIFLCYEGFEKLAHRFLRDQKEAIEEKDQLPHILDPTADLASFEQDKIKGAIRTDFILSAEIIVISLSVVATETLMVRIGVLSAIALFMTVIVYGFVAFIIKMDDFGLWLQHSRSIILRAIGRSILQIAPWLMRFLSIIGTAAMFLVGGGILVHGIPDLTSWLDALAQNSNGDFVKNLIKMLGNAFVGVTAGGVTLLVTISIQKIMGRKSTALH